MTHVIMTLVTAGMLKIMILHYNHTRGTGAEMYLSLYNLGHCTLDQMAGTSVQFSDTVRSTGRPAQVSYRDIRGPLTILHMCVSVCE